MPTTLSSRLTRQFTRATTNNRRSLVNSRRGMEARAAASNGKRYDPTKVRWNAGKKKTEHVPNTYDKEAYKIYSRARARG